MARRKFLIVAGQSNATATAPAQEWEDLHLPIAMRSPRNPVTQIPQYAEGAYRDDFTMPTTFKGGPCYSQFGDSSQGSWQTVNCKGRAMQAVRFLTPYNPTPSYLNLGSGQTFTYPGTGVIGLNSTPTVLNTTVRWQYDPAGLVITRLRTGSTHTIQAGWSSPTQQITISPAMVPAPELYEQFTYTVTSGATGSTTTLKLVQQFGGLHDLGSTYDSIDVAGGHHCRRRTIRTSAGALTYGRISCRSRPVYPGQPIAFKSAANTNGATAANDVTNRFTGGTNFAIDWANGDAIVFVDTGTGEAMPSGMAFGTTYFIRDKKSDDTFAVSETYGGAIKDFGAGFTLSASLIVFFTRVQTQVYYVTRVATELESVAITSSNSTSNRIVVHGLVDGEIIRVNDSPPTGLSSSTDYYTKRPTTAIAEANWTNSGGDLLATSTAHGWQDGEPIYMTPEGGGTLPTGLSENVVYYIVGSATDTFKLSSTTGGTPITFTDDGTGTHTVSGMNCWNLSLTDGGASVDWSATGGTLTSVTRRAAYFHFYFAATPGGTEITIPYDSNTNDVLYVLESFRGSLTGLNVRCTSGANSGYTVPAADIHFASGKTVVNLGSEFPNTPVAGETYVIEPPTIGTTSVPFEKWALWLPWSPFEGLAVPSGLIPCTVTSSNGGAVLVEQSSTVVTVNDVVRFYTTGTLPDGLIPGKRYYVGLTGNEGDSETGAAFYLSDSYGASYRIGSTDPGSGTGSHAMVVLHQEGKTNPFPPGFNYPNHNNYLNAITTYQPFDGPEILSVPRMGVHVGLGVRLYEYYGEHMYVLPCAFGGTSIAHQEVIPGNTGGGAGFAWSDPKQQLSWSPGEGNNCFQRFLDLLDAAKLAFEAQGDTGECIGIVWLQGEADASYEDWADRYFFNAKRLRTAMRQAIKDRNLTSLKASEIIWLHPKIKEVWTYHATVNAAIEKLVTQDQFTRTCEVEDLDVITGDPLHYSGAGHTTLEGRLYDALLSALRTGVTEVDICNLALSNIGHVARITSIDPADGSAEAAHCATFYPLARNEMLERHAWDFATKRATLVEIEHDRTDWSFCYEYRDDEEDIGSILGVQPTGSTSDNSFEPYTVEVDATGLRRIFTNVEDAILVYVSKLATDPARFSNLFIKALSWELAARLAGPITKEMGRVAECEKLARYYGGQAATHDSNRKRKVDPKPDNTPSWLRGRGVSGAS